MAGFHTQVKLYTFDFEDSQLTVNLASGITSADIGKAVAQDATADNQVKLAGDGDEIVGQLYSVEDRVNEGQLVGTVKFRFAAQLPIKSGLTGLKAVARGRRLCGAGAGEVRAIDPTLSTGDVALHPVMASAPRAWAISGAKVTAGKFN